MSEFYAFAGAHPWLVGFIAVLIFGAFVAPFHALTAYFDWKGICEERPTPPQDGA